jgi:signal transduction histidine kinase
MKNWSMDLLKYRAFPDLAAAVRARRDMITQRWEQAVKAMLPSAEPLTLKDVRDSLPDTLMIMADALKADDPKATKDLMDWSMAHGETRFDQNYPLAELMMEYGLLRPLMIEECSIHLDRVLSLEEAQALNLAIDVASRRGVITYVLQQKAEMQALVEAQSKYLSFLSHDLRGNLNGVLLMIEVLRGDLATEPRFAESMADLDVMRRAILETVGTMDRFLHAERFRKGKVQVKPANVDLAKLAGDIVNQFSYQAKDKNLELRCEVAPGAAAIVSDRELLLMILQNLVGNAIKYSKQGAVRIVTAKQGDGSRLSVVDQGPGIDEKQLARMFQPFARGETHGQAGTGLGLSIARQAADLLGAKLWAESEAGRGCSFHLDLPPQPPAKSA